ncbi:MAG: hypothetical protein M0Z85_03110 [Gammaproteobacteria bacterium]|nr:hypothetical protein [Gammaproteobacteria bacterium]
MFLFYKLWQIDLIVCDVIATVWLLAFRHPAVRRDPEALWTWPFTREARDAAILIGLAVLVLAPIPLAGGYYAIKAAIPAGLAYYYVHEWLAAEDPQERGIVALVGTFGELAILAVIWPVLLPVLALALFVGVGCWLAGRRVG